MTSRLHLARPDRRTIFGVNSRRATDWRLAWALLVILVCLGGLATFEPETAEAAKTTIGVGALGGVLWGIWHLMQYDQ